MKICHVFWGYEYGGIETMLVNIANLQAEAGHEVHILVINDAYEQELLDKFHPSIRKHFVNRRVGSHSPLPVIHLNYMLWRIGADICHFHRLDIPKYIFRPMLRHYCATHHTDYTPAMKSWLPINRYVTAITQAAADNILSNTGRQCRVMPNGIDSSKFRVKTAWRGDTGPLRIVQLGRLTPTKGQQYLIEALAMLLAKGLDCSVDFIGGGNELHNLTELAERLGVSTRVRFLGAKAPEYIHTHLADYDVLVQPSTLEGFGLTITEGMAAKLPVIVADIPCQLEVIDSGKCGLCFKAGDAADCARAIEDFARQPRPHMVELAYQRVKSFYDVRRTAENYLEYYREIISK